MDEIRKVEFQSRFANLDPGTSPFILDISVDEMNNMIEAVLRDAAMTLGAIAMGSAKGEEKKAQEQVDKLIDMLVVDLRVRVRSGITKCYALLNEQGKK